MENPLFSLPLLILLEKIIFVLTWFFIILLDLMTQDKYHILVSIYEVPLYMRPWKGLIRFPHHGLPSINHSSIPFHKKITRFLHSMAKLPSPRRCRPVPWVRERREGAPRLRQSTPMCWPASRWHEAPALRSAGRLPDSLRPLLHVVRFPNHTSWV